MFKHHYRGYLPSQFLKGCENKDRKRDIQKNGEKYRSSADWDVLLSIDLKDAIRGFFRGIVMGIDGYEECAGAMGAFLHVIVKTKEMEFSNMKIDFSKQVIHGDLDDNV